MKRRLVMLLLLLVGGAIVNVAVAWSIAYALSTRVEFPGSYSIGSTPFWGLSSQTEQGWPVHSLTTVLRDDGQVREDPITIRGLGLGRYPLWPGFAINTVFYAALLWLVFAGPFAVRRLRGGRRIRRGLCPKCAYDLRGTPRGADATGCPECGTEAGATGQRAR